MVEEAFLTREEMAERLGLSPAAIDRLIESGELHAEERDGARVITAHNFERYLRETGAAPADGNYTDNREFVDQSAGNDHPREDHQSVTLPPGRRAWEFLKNISWTSR